MDLARAREILKPPLLFGDAEQISAVKHITAVAVLEPLVLSLRGTLCVECDGSGRMNCPECNGAGEVECDECGGVELQLPDALDKLSTQEVHRHIERLTE